MPANPHRVQPIERFPAKPRPDGRFQKRINGQLYYFGSSGDRIAALKEYDKVKARLYAGQAVPRSQSALNDASIKDIINRFLFDKEGDLKPITFRQYRHALRRFGKFFGGNTPWASLTVDDFTRYAKHLKTKVGGYAFNRERAAIVAMFNYSEEQTWIDRAPRYGRNFRKVPKGQLRAEKNEVMLGQGELSAALGLAGKQMFAMILLGVNGGMGPADLQQLDWRQVDVANSLISDRRAKNNLPRNVTLWPETLFAMLRCRRHGDNLVFRMKGGKPWTTSEICHQFAKVAERAGLDLPDRVGMYAWRHTFYTLANETRDTDARKRIMGHKLPGLDDDYVLTIFKPRLKIVTDHVRQSLDIPNIIGNIDSRLRILRGDGSRI